MCLWQASNRERQRDELEHQRDELERVSRVDPLTGALTGALNRRGFEKRLSRDGVDAGELFRRADESLHAAKGTRPGRPSAAALELSWAAALADAVDRRMGAEHNHSRGVAGHAVAIAAQLGWTDAEQGRLRLAATLHDIGKVGVPERVLRKPGPLTHEEFAEVSRHTVVGAEIISRIVGLDAIVPWVRHSHEHVDGSGYPDGLVGDAIPLASRILLVADAFDAMTSDRSYRSALPVDEAIEELERNAGTQFDAAGVAALVGVI